MSRPPYYVTAYALAVKHGFQGTEEQWLESLKGDKGDPGPSSYAFAVKNGFQGTEEQWLESLRGMPGSSSYEIALKHGFVGTEAEWLLSLPGMVDENGYVLKDQTTGERFKLYVESGKLTMESYAGRQPGGNGGFKGLVDSAVAQYLENNLPAAGGGDNWELIVDITLEESTKNIEAKWVNTPQRKIRARLDTLAAEADTSYMPVSVWTTDARYTRAIQFYPKAMPMKKAQCSYFEIESMGIGMAEVGLYSTTGGNIDSSKIARIEDLTGGKIMMTPVDSYGHELNDQLTAISINTYGTFEPGTRLRVWGVAK